MSQLQLLLNSPEISRKQPLLTSAIRSTLRALKRALKVVKTR
jgi:hypothetical protein